MNTMFPKFTPNIIAGGSGKKKMPFGWNQNLLMEKVF